VDLVRFLSRSEGGVGCLLCLMHRMIATWSMRGLCWRVRACVRAHTHTCMYTHATYTNTHAYTLTRKHSRARRARTHAKRTHTSGRHRWQRFQRSGDGSSGWRGFRVTTRRDSSSSGECNKRKRGRMRAQLEEDGYKRMRAHLQRRNDSDFAHDACSY